LLGRLKIDYELKLPWLLHRQVGGLGALENLINVGRGAAEEVGNTHAIGHKPSFFHIFGTVVHRWEPALCREVYNLFSVRKEDGGPQHQDCVSTPIACGAECSLNVLGT